MSDEPSKCDCRIGANGLLKMCAEHLAQWNARHEQARQEYYRTQRPDLERTQLDGSDLL